MKRREIRTIETPAAPRAVGPYSQALRWEDLLMASGQIGIDPSTGGLVGSDVRSQTKQVLANLANVLHAGGSHPSRVLKVTVYLDDMSAFGEMNEEYGAFFAPHRPARSTVEVAALPLGAKVLIDAIAAASEESGT